MTEQADWTLERFRHREPFRVRWSEVDLQKIVFNAHYLTYFDVAIASYWRANAMPYEEAVSMLGGDIFLKKNTLTYQAPALYEDRLVVGLRCADMGRSSMRFEGAVFRDQSCLVQGELLYVWADSATRTSQPIPPALRDMMEQFERGQAPTTCRVDRWQAQAEAAQQVRRAVFIEEQGIDPADEYDAADATCDHAVVYNRLQQPVATGRLLPSEQGVATIGRMATLRVLRGSGLGAQVLEALMAQARARGDKRVQLHAQCSAQGFYAGLGYEPLGQPYQEVGIPHITMQRAL